MNKKTILFSIVLVFILSVGFVSAWDNFGNKKDTFREITDFKKTTETTHRDPLNFERIKITNSQRIEVFRESRSPSYNSMPYSNFRYSSPSNYRWSDSRCDINDNRCRRDYYYQPRFDHNMGYYNWRY